MVIADTTSMNPQFHIQIPRSPSLSKCHVVVSVTQQYETNQFAETGSAGGAGSKKRKKRKLHHIGFAVYEVPPHMTRLTPVYVAEHVSVHGQVVNVLADPFINVNDCRLHWT